VAREPDPPTQLAALERALATGELAPAYVLRGDERWFRERAAAAIVARAREKGLELARHDGADPDLSLARLLDDLQAQPMFAEARCVHVSGATALLKKEGKQDAPLTRAALAFLKAAAGGVLVVDAEGLRADHALCKATVAAGGTLFTGRKLYDSPPPWAPHDMRRVEIVQWIGARAREHGLALAPDRALVLVESIGNDLHALDAELARLAALPRGAAGHAGAAARPADQRLASAWNVAEDLVCGNLARGLAGVERLFRTGMDRSGTQEVDPRALTSVLASGLRSKLRQARAAVRVLDAGGDLAAAAAAAGVGSWQRARDEFTARLGTRPRDAWGPMLADVVALERRTRENLTVDANDFFALALGWRRYAVRREPARQPERDRARPRR
jgi:hypothetical protein